MEKLIWMRLRDLLFYKKCNLEVGYYDFMLLLLDKILDTI